jgi:glycerol uptake facilitator-like aquaporin
MDARDLRTYAAELLGTFVLVFVGTTAVVAAGRLDAPVLLVAALAFGLALLAALYAFAEVSRGPLRPPSRWRCGSPGARQPAISPGTPSLR